MFKEENLENKIVVLAGLSYIYTGLKNNNARIISYSGLGRLLIIQFIISFIIVLVQFIKYIQKIFSNKV